MRKKNLSVRRKIFKVWRGGKKCKCRISGVRKKKEIERKSSICLGKKKCFRVKIKVKDFAKFVLTSWALSCKILVKILKVETLCCRKKNEIKNVRVVDVPLVGHHVVKHG